MGSNSSLDTLSVMSLPTVERSKSWNNMRQKSEDTMSLYSLSEDYDSGVDIQNTKKRFDTAFYYVNLYLMQILSNIRKRLRGQIQLAEVQIR